MSLARKCDICGKLYEYYEAEFKFRNFSGRFNGIRFVRGNQFETDIKDCCPDCMESIMLHLKNLRGEKND